MTAGEIVTIRLEARGISLAPSPTVTRRSISMATLPSSCFVITCTLFVVLVLLVTSHLRWEARDGHGIPGRNPPISAAVPQAAGSYLPRSSRAEVAG